MSQRITITLPDEVYQKIKEQAERDFRTIGAEIAYLLHLHVPAYKDLSLDPNQITPRAHTYAYTYFDQDQQSRRTIIG